MAARIIHLKTLLESARPADAPITKINMEKPAGVVRLRPARSADSRLRRIWSSGWNFERVECPKCAARDFHQLTNCQPPIRFRLA